MGSGTKTPRGCRAASTASSVGTAMVTSPAVLCLLAWLLRPAGGHLWAWMFSLPPHSPDAAALGRGPGTDMEEVTPCSPANPCSQGHFCDEHFGLCLPCRPAGQFCRHDPHCAPGLLCMFGKCQQPVPAGQDGARCERDEECGPGGCCARQHGERVCQRRLQLAQSCHVPPGGLAFSINQVCPCQAGLVCRPSAPSRERAFEYRPEKSEWRCRQP